MPQDNSWTEFTKLKYAEVGIGVAGIILTVLDLAANDSAILTWIWNTVWSTLFVEVKIWHLITAVSLLILLAYVGRTYFKYDYEHVMGVNWITNSEDEELEYPIPICPECGMELEIDSRVVDTFDPYTPGVRSHGNIVCAKTTCNRCGFEKEWSGITDKVVSTLSHEGTPKLDKKVRNEAKKRIRSKRRRQRRLIPFFSRD